MNNTWSQLNKEIQSKIKKKDSYKEGIIALFDLRNILTETLKSFYKELSRKDFDAIPFVNSDGYHNKTIAYSIWHIFRIEDIVAHTLIADNEQIFFSSNYQKRINSPIITTGNELLQFQIADFSKQLNLEELYSYIFDVKNSSEKIINSLSYDELKNKIPEKRKEKLKLLNVVSNDKDSIWLIDYWCK